MRKKSKSRSSPTKLSPRSTVDADIEMGRRIRLRRREKGISQRKLTGGLGLTFQQVQKYEEGTNRVGAARLQQIAKMLGVDIPFFYDGDGKEPDSVLILNSASSLRLLRAYTAIKGRAVQIQLVSLVEMIAALSVNLRCRNNGAASSCVGTMRRGHCAGQVRGGHQAALWSTAEPRTYEEG